MLFEQCEGVQGGSYLEFGASNGQQSKDPVKQPHGQEVRRGLHVVLGSYVCQPLEQDRPHGLREVSLELGERGSALHG